MSARRNPGCSDDGEYGEMECNIRYRILVRRAIVHCLLVSYVLEMTRATYTALLDLSRRPPCSPSDVKDP